MNVKHDLYCKIGLININKSVCDFYLFKLSIRDLFKCITIVEDKCQRGGYRRSPGRRPRLDASWSHALVQPGSTAVQPRRIDGQ